MQERRNWTEASPPAQAKTTHHRGGKLRQTMSGRICNNVMLQRDAVVEKGVAAQATAGNRKYTLQEGKLAH